MTVERPRERDRHTAAPRALTLVALLTGFVLLSALGAHPAPIAAEPPGQAPGVEQINHIIVIYQENWSFDGLYGRFPGANGVGSAGAAARQVDREGRPYAVLPQPIDTSRRPPGPDPRFPADLPVAPFDASPYVSPGERTGDLVHRFYQQQLQINGGAMDKFVAWSDAAGLVMSYYDATNLPEGRLAQQYTIADNFFHAAFGGSFLNHFWLICACTPVWPNAPADTVVQLDANGILARDGSVTPDGFAVNTAQPNNPPFAAGFGNPAQRMPPQTMPTIGERLSEAGVSWAWYSGGWNDAVAGRPNPLFQFHHQPFNYFANYADGQPARGEHLKDTDDFLAALRGGTLPAVSFVKPQGSDNEHPGYADLLRGQQYVADLVAAVQASPHWRDTAIVIAYDENGGRWDHVTPPVSDRWGPGTRVPGIIISPFARRGFIDSTVYDTTSILKLIETRWGLASLASRDAAANDMLAAFDFSQEPAGTGNITVTINIVDADGNAVSGGDRSGFSFTFEGDTTVTTHPTPGHGVIGVFLPPGGFRFRQVDKAGCMFQSATLDNGTVTLPLQQGDSIAASPSSTNNIAVNYSCAASTGQDSSGTSADLHGVACVSSSFCKAVGEGGTILSFNGSGWSAETSTTSQTLYGVACASPSSCKAVGALGRIRTWNGSSWSPDTNAVERDLHAVACVSASFCKAVGVQGMILSWNGSIWSADTSSTEENLNGVACVSPSFCKAVGDGGTVLSWNGTRWSGEESTTSQTLIGVTCVSPTFCKAAGLFGRIRSYNGSAWSADDSTTSQDLLGVSCTSAQFCKAVGRIGRIRSWNGSAWSPDANPSVQDLRGVACVSPAFCKAVGSRGTIVSSAP